MTTEADHFLPGSPAAVSSVAHAIVESLDDAVLGADDHRHITRVLRARPGEVVTLTDGRGKWRRAVVPDTWTDPTIQLTDLGPVQTVAHRPELCIGVALVKADKPETVVQKLTEIGIARIVLLSAAHSVVRWDSDKGSKNLVRLAAIAREAVMQSRGVWLPVISGPVSPSAFIEAELARGRIVAAAQLGGEPVSAELDTIMIGPEGGWSAEERVMFGRTVMLSHNVLRAETAAITAGVLLAVLRPS